MGFTEPNFPRVEPEAFLKAPFLERVKTLTLNWVENGYGVPRMVHAIYIVSSCSSMRWAASWSPR